MLDPHLAIQLTASCITNDHLMIKRSLSDHFIFKKISWSFSLMGKNDIFMTWSIQKLHLSPQV